MNLTKQWYAVYTKPRWEKKISELLNKKHIENYCPLNKVVSQWTDRKKTVLKPLFTSYVFIHVTESEFSEVKQTDGILNFVFWLGKPAVIKAEEISTIKQFLLDHEDVKLEQIAVNIRDTVRVLNGPLMSREGNIIEVKNQTVKILLPSLGFAMIAEVETANVEVITAASSFKTYAGNGYLKASVG